MLALPPKLIFLFSHENVRVVHLVVIIIELHRAALERIFLIHFLLLLGLARGHEDALFEEMCCGHDRVCI